MLTYSFENIGAESLYEHLYRCIRADILAGRLQAGEKLPSKRSLAHQLGISVITVEGAYGQLVAEGYCQSVPKKGFFVARLSSLPIKPAQAQRVHREPEACLPEYLADFTANSLRPEDFPFKTWTRLLRQVMAQQAEELLERSPGMGIMSLRETIANHLRSFRGLDVAPEQIVVGAGTEYLYGLLVQLLGRDKCFGVENPGFDKIRQVYRQNAVRCVPVAMDEQGICPQELQEKGVDVLHISPSHHFPTGCITPISRRYELLGWASAGEGRFIIEDDYDSEFRFVGRPIPTLFSIDGGEQVVYLNTFSKTIAPSIRISFMVLPRRLLADFRQKLGFYACTVSAFEQYTLAQFLAGGWYEKHLSRMRKHYRQKRDAVIAAVYKSPLAPYAAITEEDAGLHFLLRLDGAPSDETLRREAEQRGIRLAMLSDYYQRPQDAPQHVLVVNYTGIDLDRLPAALERLAALWKENDHV